MQQPRATTRTEMSGATADRMRWLASTSLWWLGAAAVIGGLWTAAGAPHQDYFDAQVQLGAVRDLVQGNDPYSKYVQSPLWTYVLMLPYGFLPVEASYPAQFAGNVALWLAASFLLVRASGVPWRWPKLLIAAGLLTIYAPAMWSTRGQVNGYNALGLGLFVSLLARRPGWAGASLVLLLAKPHLGFVSLGALAGWLALTRQWRAIWGGAASFGALTAVTLGLRPQWPAQWLTALANPLPEVVAGRAKFAPTVGYFLGLWLPPAVTTAAGVLAAAGTTGGLVLWLLRAARRISAAQVIAISGPAVFLITPYSQGYDISLLVPSLALMTGALFRLPPRRRAYLVAGMAVTYGFPVLLVWTAWQQATLLAPAALCLALAVVFRDSLTPAGVPLTASSAGRES